MITLSATRRPKREGELDFYETPENAVLDLLSFIKIVRSDIVLDAGCGTGNIACVLKQFGHEVVGIDINPEMDVKCPGVNIIHYDFLLPQFNLQVNWVIMNPPFNVAQEFIDKALTLAPKVVALVRSGFTHTKKRSIWLETLPLRWELKSRSRYSFNSKGTDNSEYSWLYFDTEYDCGPPMIAWIPVKDSVKLI